MRPPIQAQIGDRCSSRDVGPITQTDIVRFAGAGGDFNPLHHDPDFVRASGFPGVLAMGQMQAGMLAGWLSDWVGTEHLREYEVRFVAPVFLDDALRLSGEIVAIAPEGEDSVADIRLTVSRDDEVVVVKASAKAVVTEG